MCVRSGRAQVEAAVELERSVAGWLERLRKEPDPIAAYRRCFMGAG